MATRNNSATVNSDNILPVAQQQADVGKLYAHEVQGYLVGAEPSQGFDESGRPNSGLLIFQATQPGIDKYGNAFQPGCKIAVRFPVVKGEGHNGNLTITGKDGKPYHYWAEKVLTPGSEYVVSHASYMRADGNTGLLLQIQDA